MLLLFTLQLEPQILLYSGSEVLIVTLLNILKTKRNLLYIRNQSVPRCKHFPPQL